MPHRQAQSLRAKALQGCSQQPQWFRIDGAEHLSIGRAVTQPSFRQGLAPRQGQQLLPLLDVKAPSPLFEGLRLDLQLLQPLLFLFHQLRQRRCGGV